MAIQRSPRQRKLEVLKRRHRDTAAPVPAPTAPSVDGGRHSSFASRNAGPVKCAIATKSAALGGRRTPLRYPVPGQRLPPETAHGSHRRPLATLTAADQSRFLPGLHHGSSLLSPRSLGESGRRLADPAASPSPTLRHCTRHRSTVRLSPPPPSLRARAPSDRPLCTRHLAAPSSSSDRARQAALHGVGGGRQRQDARDEVVHAVGHGGAVDDETVLQQGRVVGPLTVLLLQAEAGGGGGVKGRRLEGDKRGWRSQR